MKKTADILDWMTKEEIIAWVRGQLSFQLGGYSSRPKKSEVIFMRWETKYKELEKKRAKHSENLKSINFEKHDEYARQFNASVDNAERLALLEKMQPYQNGLNQWWKHENELRIEEKKLDRLYAFIEEARKTE